ncbi:MAG TPA: LiaF domain-containing protein [Gemmatimonadaceae bacterium]|nr:LiaF domain-containing protein [Gemmatimonadaceae bacterium]
MNSTRPVSPLVPASERGSSPMVIAEELVPDRRGAVAFLSSTNRDGDWILPRSFRVVSFMGNVELDLTNVRLGSGESHIEIRCVFGNVEITVPPGLRIEVEGQPFIGTFEVTRSAPSTTAPEAPLLRVTGSSHFGAVTVKVVDPNAPGWIERIRARLSSKKG